MPLGRSATVSWIGPSKPRRSAEWGVGPDSVAVFENWTAEEERAETNRIRSYEQAINGP